MISQDTKDQIDKVGKQHARAMYPGGDRLNHGRIAFAEGYSEGAYEYAEKLEEKDKIIEYKDKEIKELEKQLILNEEAEIQFIKQLESKDRELAELKELLNYYKDKADKGEGILKSATDIHFVPGKEGDNLLAAKDRELAQLRTELKESEDTNFHMSADLTRQDWKIKKLEAELAQLKEIAEKMKEALEAQPDMYSLTIDVKNKALTAYAEWCKQNLK